jgi:ferredoxin
MSYIIIEGCVGCGQCAELCENIEFQGYTAIINQKKCIRCKKCLKFDCSGNAFKEVE